MDLLPPDLLSQISAFGQIVLIDLALAGDNAIVVGMAAAGLPPRERHRAILAGIIGATILRVLFALMTVQLLQIIGLTLAGGLLLLWVSWKLYKQLHHQHHPAPEENAASAAEAPAAPSPESRKKSLKNAIFQIIVADVSMSLDNVLGVAGAAREHPWILVTGLTLSVLLMGAAATIVVRLLHRYHWISYAGLLVIFYVALRMIWEGSSEVIHRLPGVLS